MTKFLQNHNTISISTNFTHISTNATSFNTLACVLTRDLEGKWRYAQMNMRST